MKNCVKLKYGGLLSAGEIDTKFTHFLYKSCTRVHTRFYHLINKKTPIFCEIRAHTPKFLFFSKNLRPPS